MMTLQQHQQQQQQWQRASDNNTSCFSISTAYTGGRGKATRPPRCPVAVTRHRSLRARSSGRPYQIIMQRDAAGVADAGRRQIASVACSDSDSDDGEERRTVERSSGCQVLYERRASHLIGARARVSCRRRLTTHGIH